MTRDEKGRFVKGHKGAGGRPKREVEQSYLEITLGAVPPDQWQRIVKKAAEQAEEGDTAARKWLSDYILGTPVNRTEVTGAGGKELIIRIIDDDHIGAEASDPDAEAG